MKQPTPGVTSVGGLSRHHGEPVQLALAEWLEELAVYGNPRNPQDSETAWQLSQAIENWYLVRVALRASGV
jgi:hypothetical protein